ncbi:hypothetical protein [Streptomyces sp. NPDC093261]
MEIHRAPAGAAVAGTAPMREPTPVTPPHARAALRTHARSD